MIIFNENLRLKGTSLNFIVEQSNINIEVACDSDDLEKKEKWKKTYHSTMESACKYILKITSEDEEKINNILSLINEISIISKETNHTHNFKIGTDFGCAISNTRFGFTIDYGNGKLIYAPSSMYVFSDILSHRLLSILEREEDTYEDIISFLGDFKDKIGRCSFEYINPSLLKSEDMEEENE